MQQAPLSMSPTTNSADVMPVTVAVVRSQATMVKGELGGVAVDVMLDSGSSVSLVQYAIHDYKGLLDTPDCQLEGIVE